MPYATLLKHGKSMYKQLRTIITICARGGSKGVPGKNIKPLMGKPLIIHTIEQAKSLGWADRIMVSTDDEKIRTVAQDSGIEVPFLRPAELAQDDSPKLPVLINAVKTAENYWQENYDLVVDLDPTNPLRTTTDIIGVIESLIINPKALTSFSVTQAYKNPYMNMVESTAFGYVKVVKKPPWPIMRRQDAPTVYEVVASIYAIRRSILESLTYFPTKKNTFYVMPEERALDIDSEVDFEIIELLMKRKKHS